MTESKVTKIIVRYPEGQQPNFVIPTTYAPYRFLLGRQGSNPLVAIGMNPSAARDATSDRTVNRVIAASEKQGYDGWTVINTYPERATDAANMDALDENLLAENLATVRTYLVANDIKEVWGAWGDLKFDALIKGRDALLALLKELDVQVFYFKTLTKAGNPRHPLYLKIDIAEKFYLDF